MNEKKNFWSGLIVGLLVAILLFCGAYAGKQFGLLNREKKQAKTSESANATVVNAETLQKMQILEDAVDQYYYEDVKEEDVAEGVYKGLIESLDDPYSTYYSVEELAEIKDKTKGIYYGIGAYLGYDEEVGMTRITSVMEGTPAQESGLLAGDYIYLIDGESAKGMELEDVVTKVKGPAGTKVKLTIVRAEEAQTREIEVERREIESPTVKYTMDEDGIAYIQITEFDEVTLDQFKEAFVEAKANNMKGLIIDLRNNLGGNLSTVTDIARMMLPEGLIVYTEDKYGKKVEYSCDGKNELQVPLVVLVNEYSASASEILAGAIKDYQLGTLVGTTTFGKGIVQQIISLTDGSAVKLTVSKYYTPKGNNIHKIGIVPDEEVKLDTEAYIKKGTDNQLDRGKEILKEKMK